MNPICWFKKLVMFVKTTFSTFNFVVVYEISFKNNRCLLIEYNVFVFSAVFCF